MVATGVAATAYFYWVFDSLNVLMWRQVSNTITARKLVAGVDTQLYTATWSATTYKYLRIRESAGTIYFDSSTNGTSWTNRASIVGLPFAVTDLKVYFGASCGNVASPGTFKLEDFNLILPALTTNWRWTQIIWPFDERTKTVTTAIDAAGTVQGYLVTADGVDASNAPSGNVRYWSGPASGGRELTSQTTQAAAQAMAVNFPLDGRLDLPSMVEGHCYRIYHRSIDGAAYTLRELYPRRLLQADDIEAEIIRGMTILGHQFVADKLSALTANIGQLVIDTTGYIWQGTGTAAVPTTGLKIYNSGGIGKLSTYNAGIVQVELDTDGILKAGAGTILIDADGILIKALSGTIGTTRYISWQDSSGLEKLGIGVTSTMDASQISSSIRLDILVYGGDDINISTESSGLINLNGEVKIPSDSLSVAIGLNVGTATGAGTGQIKTSGGVGIGGAVSDVLTVTGSIATAKIHLYSSDVSDSHIYLLSGEPGITYQAGGVAFNWRQASGAAMARQDTGIGGAFVRLSSAAIDLDVISAAGTSTRVLHTTTAGIDIKAGALLVTGTQVVGARKTGWGTPTGTLYRTALTNASTQAQFNQAIMAIATDLISHGLLGA